MNTVHSSETDPKDAHPTFEELMSAAEATVHSDTDIAALTGLAKVINYSALYWSTPEMTSGVLPLGEPEPLELA
jgi:hypothetical protein